MSKRESGKGWHWLPETEEWRFTPCEPREEVKRPLSMRSVISAASFAWVGRIGGLVEACREGVRRERDDFATRFNVSSPRADWCGHAGCEGECA